MAYYIFLKSLRRLEEFRKNSHIKIPPKSPYTNFQSIGKFKNPIFIPKRISLQFPAQSAQPRLPACSTFRPVWPTLGLFFLFRPRRPSAASSSCQLGVEEEERM
jgi:hypothetical protein